MKTAVLATVLATALSFCTAAPADEVAGSVHADGFYVQTMDATGNIVTSFTPWVDGQPGNATTIPTPASDLQVRSVFEKRREACSGNKLAYWKTDEANRRLLESWAGDRISIDPGWGYQSRTWHVYEGALSFVCAYNAGWKPKTSIAGSWDYVKNRCCRDGSVGCLGYAQVQEGSGDWTAGYTFDGDKFCW